jgi:hypothetical protein
MRDKLPGRRQPALAPLDDDFDHFRGPAGGRLILEYSDYECPYSQRRTGKSNGSRKNLAGVSGLPSVIFR